MALGTSAAGAARGGSGQWGIFISLKGLPFRFERQALLFIIVIIIVSVYPYSVFSRIMSWMQGSALEKAFRRIIDVDFAGYEARQREIFDDDLYTGSLQQGFVINASLYRCLCKTQKLALYRA